MRTRYLLAIPAAALLGLGYSLPAQAVGCLSGGVAGAVAGHMAHHGVLGAVGGCIAGHEYHKHQQREEAAREQAQSPGYASQSHHHQGTTDEDEE